MAHTTNGGIMIRLNNKWEFTNTWSEDFMKGFQCNWLGRNLWSGAGVESACGEMLRQIGDCPLPGCVFFKRQLDQRRSFRIDNDGSYFASLFIIVSDILVADRSPSDRAAAFHLFISYNNEGIIPFEKFKEIVAKYGDWELLEQEYNTYRGSRNLRARSNKVKELLWLIKKS